MKRTLLPAVLGLFLASAAAAETQWLTSLDEALSRASRDDSKILVDLYAQWCGWCKVLDKQVFTTPEFREFTRGFVLLRVDVEDGGEGTALQARFGINDLPTTLVLDKNQVRIGTVSGFAPAPEFLRRLRAELAAYDAFLEYYERMKTSDDLGVLYRLAQELHFSRGDGARAAEVLKTILSKTDEGSPKVAFLHYLMADAHRLAGRFEEAQRVLQRARSLNNGADLAERIDMLSYRIAQDSHNCETAKKTLEHFLEAHPDSSHRGEAQRALEALRHGQGMICA